MSSKLYNNSNNINDNLNPDFSSDWIVRESETDFGCIDKRFLL